MVCHLCQTVVMIIGVVSLALYCTFILLLPLSIGRTASHSHYNFEIEDIPYTRHVNQVQEVIWVLPSLRGVIKNDVTINKSCSHNSNIKYYTSVVSDQLL